ncbi:hypothetical protein [Janibacter sp. G1551]|uniref:hypothetical protein n=1 Tax=Janibacter sp. G1551 TaxID=3420440 RepID=UPI003CFF8D82
MSITQPFTMHTRAGWELLSASESNPLWLRTACLAYARCQPNGHTLLPRGALALSLSSKDPASGVPVIPDRRTVFDAIRAAIDKGWLRPGSSARCLRVPVTVTYGKGGYKAMALSCPWCDRA